MPRQRRIHVSGGLYHAVLRGNHRQAIFGASDDYLCFEEIVARAFERYGASLFAYCWMTNHVHLAIRIAEAPLGSVMGIVATRYARAKQRAAATTGHLFERRCRARLVDADRYLLALVRYVQLNPVRARMVADPREFARRGREHTREQLSNGAVNHQQRQQRVCAGRRQLQDDVVSDRGDDGEESQVRCMRQVRAMARQAGKFAARDTKATDPDP
jgi:REP element-mobilizing transposase RayT